VFPWARFRATKAAVKMHTLLDLRGPIPTFIEVSDGKLPDVKAPDLILPEPGSFYVMDRAYLDFERLRVFHDAGAFFVTLAKRGIQLRRPYSRTVDANTGLRSDHKVSRSARNGTARGRRSATHADNGPVLSSAPARSSRKPTRCAAAMSDPIATAWTNR
jgi:hypothetical protein